MKDEEIKELNIYQKLSLITTEMAVVEKNLKVEVNQKNSYKAVSERDILDNVKPLEAKYHIYSYPFERQIIDKDVLTKETEYNDKITRTNTLFMRLETIYRFINMDKPEEFIDIKTYGDGLDSGDKATGKAMTYADKYALMKCYKISTGDDPDKEASQEEDWKAHAKLVSEVQTMAIKTNTELKDIANNYGAEEIKDMSTKDLESAIRILKRKETNILEQAEKELNEND